MTHQKKIFYAILSLVGVLLCYFFISRANEVKEMTYGLYCGECTTHCSIIVKLNHKEAYADTTDAFLDAQFKNKPYQYFESNNGIRLSAETHQEIVKLLSHTPSYIALIQNTMTGCPDCTDGCGLYMKTQGVEWLIDPYEGPTATFSEAVFNAHERIYDELFVSSTD